MCSTIVDFSAAYDRVGISVATRKDFSLSLRAKHAVLDALLSDRSEAHGLHINSIGRPRVVGCGLPQGSSLSPSLWNLYILNLDVDLTMLFNSASPTIRVSMSVEIPVRISSRNLVRLPKLYLFFATDCALRSARANARC